MKITIDLDNGNGDSVTGLLMEKCPACVDGIYNNTFDDKCPRSCVVCEGKGYLPTKLGKELEYIVRRTIERAEVFERN